MAGAKVRIAVVSLAALWAVVFLLARAGFAPVGEAHSSCGVPHHPGQAGFSPAYQPTTNELSATFVDASQNELYPGVGNPWWLYNTETGSRSSRQSGVPSVPPTLLKAIGWVESSWHQAHYDVARGSSGEILVSFDCGYGIMQATNALGYNMNTSSDPDGVKKRLATEFRRNVAFGANVLIDKWNAAPQFRPIVGNGNPSLLEDWYYALWSYNGFASANDPNQYPLTRGEYRCDGNNYTGFPYQERVIGCVRNAPQGLWTSIAMSYRKTLPAFTGCSGSCNTSSMDISTPTPTHTDGGGGGGGGGGDTGSPEVTARKTLDRDADGHLDAVELTFDEVVNDDFSGFRAAVKGYCDQDTGTARPTCTYDGAGSGNDKIMILLPERSKGDTDKRAAVSFVANSSLGDAAGNDVAADGLRRKASDGAGPAIVSARTISGNVVEVIFSEPLAAGSVQRGDFLLRVDNQERALDDVNVGDNAKKWQLISSNTWDGDANGQVRLTAANAVSDQASPANGNRQTTFVDVDDGF